MYCLSHSRIAGKTSIGKIATVQLFENLPRNLHYYHNEMILHLYLFFTIFHVSSGIPDKHFTGHMDKRNAQQHGRVIAHLRTEEYHSYSLTKT